MEKGLSVS